jgi:hypothetical protein
MVAKIAAANSRPMTDQALLPWTVGKARERECDALARSACELVHTAGVA